MPRSPLPRLVEFCTDHARLGHRLRAGRCPASAPSIRRRISGWRPTPRSCFRAPPMGRARLGYIDRFPQEGIVVVVDAPTPELVDQASTRLTAALETDHAHFRSVEDLQGDPFFARDALLYPPKEMSSRSLANGKGGAADPGVERRSEPARRADRARFRPAGRGQRLCAARHAGRADQSGLGYG